MNNFFLLNHNAQRVNIHKNLSVINGSLCVNNDEENSLFIERDIMYADSSMYSWFMAFILLGIATYQQIVYRTTLKYNTRFGKFVKALEIQLQNNVHCNLNEQYEVLFKASGLHKDVLVFKPDVCFMDWFIINHSTLNNAVIIEFEVVGFESTFSMLLTGFEASDAKTIKKLYVLNTETEEAPKAYYNAVFEKDDKKSSHPFCWLDFAENETHRALIKNVVALQKHQGYKGDVTKRM